MSRLVKIYIILTLIIFLIAVRLFINLANTQNEIERKAIIKSSGDNYIEIVIESYRTEDGKTYITDIYGNRYITSDFTIIERKLGD